jgi:hypothetical protein
VFTVIAAAPALADSERRIAIASGPTFVDVPHDYAVLLEGMQARAGALVEVLGADELTKRTDNRQARSRPPRLDS